VTVSQKAALSLLISVFLFAGFAVLAYTGLFDLVEARFYNPAITKSLNREVSLDSETVRDFLVELQNRFSETLNEPAVRRSILPNQSAEDIFERSRIYGVLLESLGGLQSVRFVDSGGIRIHFSTAAQDIQSQDRLSIAYRNYNEDPGNIPFNTVEVPAQGSIKYTFDDERERIVLSFPFYDSLEVYRGTALFTISVRAVTERLIGKGRIKAGEDVFIIANPPGIVSGLPGTTRTNILSRISSVWSEGFLTLTPLNSAASETTLALISSKTDQGIFVGRMVNENLLAFPPTMKVILLVSVFLTLYLAIFFFFNIRQDTLTVIQNRLKGLQISLIEQYYDRKGDVDWTHWLRELEQRREDIRAEVKRGIRTGQGRRSEEDLDSLIDKSWDELLAVIGGRRNAVTGIDEEKLQSILNRILQATPGLPTPSAAVQSEPRPLPAAVPAGPAGKAEGVEEAEEAEDLEELEEIEEPEEAEVLEELEEIGGPDEGADTAEPVEELEELTEAGEDEPVQSGGLLAAAEKASTVNNGSPGLGDDDIPYITESGGLDLGDQDLDSVMSTLGADDEPAELEELGAEDGELEEAEAPEETETSSASPNVSMEDLAALASQIEFSPVMELDETGEQEDPLDTDFEIVSPVTTMLSNIANIAIESDPEETGEIAPPDPAAAGLPEAVFSATGLDDTDDMDDTEDMEPVDMESEEPAISAEKTENEKKKPFQ
jgi:hypothetical protein